MVEERTGVKRGAAVLLVGSGRAVEVVWCVEKVISSVQVGGQVEL